MLGRQVPVNVLQETTIVVIGEIPPLQLMIGPCTRQHLLRAITPFTSIALAAANSKFKRPDGPRARMVRGHRHKEKIEV
jgi:hypothetical protein